MPSLEGNTLEYSLMSGITCKILEKELASHYIVILTVLKKQRNSMAENGLYINQVQTRCEVISNQLDQQVTSEPDTIITSNHNENTQDCTQNSANDLDTEERHEEDFDTTSGTNFPTATSNHEDRKIDDILTRSFELTQETCENTEDTMSPIPKRSAEFNSQIRNETDDDKVEN